VIRRADHRIRHARGLRGCTRIGDASITPAATEPAIAFVAKQPYDVGDLRDRGVAKTIASSWVVSWTEPIVEGATNRACSTPTQTGLKLALTFAGAPSALPKSAVRSSRPGSVIERTRRVVRYRSRSYQTNARGDLRMSTFRRFCR
jgi:hypothetical protein